MNVLVVSARFPWPSYTGDRMRAAVWLEALAPHARVALVAPSGDLPATAHAFRYFAAAPSFRRGAGGAMAILRRGLPMQSVLAAPFAWSDAIAQATREAGPFDATIVILSRCDPWVRGSLGGGTHFLDSIDSLRRNTAERAAAASPLMRIFWRFEERRLARAERELGRAYDRVVVVSEDETSEFGEAGMAIPNSVPIAPLDMTAPRKYDFGFWGRFAYFANADAVRWFLDEIVPAIREREPAASIVIGGADASQTLRAAASRANVELVSPIADVAAFARNVRVAIVPMRYGSGQSSKLLEAAEAGCAIVTTPQALRGLPKIAPDAAVNSDATSIATAAIALLHDDAKRAAMGDALRHGVEQHHSRRSVLTAMAELAGITTTRAAVNG
ncbi:MAG: glycosyltransferase [Acidobacteria bacterium]|nr:glycosyltransferase [Acidobacteriota bacterium]